MSLSTQPYKGARDFYPPEKRYQKYLFEVMRRVVESYGYEEYDAPIIEPIDIYLAKSNSEIVNEQTYNFEDRGGRKVTLRPEMTPSVSRMVAGMRQELAYPLRWYSIPNLWRYERPQRGRLREHWQLNVDIFGVEGLEAELEIISVSAKLMQAYGASNDSYAIRINDRKLVEYLLSEYLGVDPAALSVCTGLIDKMSKLEDSEFTRSINEAIGDDKGEKLIKILKTKDPNDLPDELRSNEAYSNVQKLIGLLKTTGIDNAIFDITLMRGFDYYTGIVFEVFDKDPSNPRAMFGGGRYDGLVGLFGAEPIASVGFGMGDVTLSDFLGTHNLVPAVGVETDLYVVMVADVHERAGDAIEKLRSSGLNVAVDLSGRNVDSQIKTALKKGVLNILFVGDEELSSGQFTLKNLKTREEKKNSLEEIITSLHS